VRWSQSRLDEVRKAIQDRQIALTPPVHAAQGNENGNPAAAKGCRFLIDALWDLLVGLIITTCHFTSLSRGIVIPTVALAGTLTMAHPLFWSVSSTEFRTLPNFSRAESDI
jgi:hypothetical protein